MDCCETKNEEGCCENFGEMKGGKRKMDMRIKLWILVGVLFIVALFLTFKAGSVGSVELAGNVAKAATSSGGMVGGC
ncbi:MAG: isoaspartyl peptidase/L-asparaginase [Nanoarchaeota archaeon]|nr:isoaspartyl peptidase/L-asparaginase [Nanoarchaeota archaeon]